MNTKTTIRIRRPITIDIENNKFPFKFIFFIKNNEYYLEYL